HRDNPAGHGHRDNPAGHGHRDNPAGHAHRDGVGSSDDRYRLLPISPVASGTTRWWSPRMSLLIAVATDVALERWLDARGITTAYIWAPEDPSLPATVSAEWSAAAAAHAQGVAIAVQPRRRGVRLPDATVWYLPSGRPGLVDTLAVGRWRMGRARPDTLALETQALDSAGWDSAGPASPGGDTPALRTAADEHGRWQGGWRFDLWQRDLLELAPPRITLPPPEGPVPWYGAGWREEVSRVWPHLELEG
ncbi:MAG: hypothetical protein ACOCYB_09390, partial [Alkalispirochaeta sp.]